MRIQQNMADIMNIIKQRKALSIAEFSAELGISCSTLQEYLNAQGNPTIQMIEHIAQKLNLDPIAFMAGMFEPDQIKILLLLLESIQESSRLPQPLKHQIAELFYQMIMRWDGLGSRNS